jgi:branched-chain amino acid transport system substrate-binding protein
MISQHERTRRKNMKSKKFLAFFMIMPAILVFSLWTVPGSTAVAAEKTLKVGALTNLGWPLGVDFKNFLDIVVPIYNKTGRLVIGGEKYKIDLILYDSKGNPEAGRAAVERLVDRDGVKFILGDETVDAWLPVTEAAKVMVIATTPTPGIFNPKNKMAFQVAWLHTQPPVMWGWFAKNYPSVKTAMAAYPDNRIGHAIARDAVKLAKVFDFKLEDPTFYPPQTTDFGAIATKIVRSNPDMFTTAGGGSVQDSLLYKALHEAGLKGKRFTINAISLDAIAKVIPLNMAEGLISAGELLNLDTPAPSLVKEFKSAYIEKQGGWDSPTTTYTNTFHCLMNGLMQAASTDPGKVASVIGSGMEFDSLAGRIKMVARPDMENQRTVDSQITVYVRQIENGKAKLVHTISLDEGYTYLKKFYGWK